MIENWAINMITDYKAGKEFLTVMNSRLNKKYPGDALDIERINSMTQCQSTKGQSAELCGNL